MLNLLRALRSDSDLTQTLIMGWDTRSGPAPTIPGVRVITIPVHRRSIHETGVRAIAEFLHGAARSLLDTNERGTHDLFHFHFSVPTGLLAALCRGTPYVCSLHGIDVPGFVTEEARQIQRLIAPLNRLVLRGAARVFVPSAALARLVSRGCPRAEIAVIPHGVDFEQYTTKSRYVPTARRFVTVARLTRWKRVDSLIRAVASLRDQLSDVTLDIYGDGDQRIHLEALIDELGARTFVTMHGFAERGVLAKKLERYDAFVLPSSTEAFGVVFLEAMAVGLPVVGCNVAGPAEVIEHGRDGLLVAVDDARELRDALEALAATPGLAERLGRAGREKVVARYGWRSTSTSYAAVYKSIVRAAS